MMNINHLNDDCLYQVFTYFIAIDDDGPFTLMLVCRIWEAMVIRHPPLWSWLIINEILEEWELRTKTCLALSADQPLCINLRLPCPVSLPMRIDLHHRHVRVVTVNLYPQIDDDRAIKEMLSLIRDFGWGTTPIYWTRNQASHHPIILTNPSYKDLSDKAVYPMNLINVIEFVSPDNGALRGPKPPSITLEALITSLSIAKYLYKLRISVSNISRGGLAELPIIYLPVLQELVLEDPEPNQETLPELFMVTIIQHMRCPTILALSLSGDFSHILSAVSNVGTMIQPSKITLSFSRTVRASTLQPLITYNLSCIHEVYIRLRFSSCNATSLATPLESLLDSFCTGSILSFDCDWENLRCLTLMKQLPRQLHIIHSRVYGNKEGFSISFTWEKGSPFISLLSIDSANIMRTLPMFHTLRLRGSHFMHMERTLFSASRKVLDCDEAALSIEVNTGSFYPNEAEDLNGSFPHFGRCRLLEDEELRIMHFEHLVVLRCPPTVATRLCRFANLPSLKELVILAPLGWRIDEKKYNTLFEDFAASIMHTDKYNQSLFPSLVIIAIMTQPSWEALFTIAKFIGEHHEMNDITIMLPSLPHFKILYPLVMLLQGHESLNITSLPPRRSEWKYNLRDKEAEPSCYECFHGGWTCEGEDSCLRHRSEMVSINRYSMESEQGGYGDRPLRALITKAENLADAMERNEVTEENEKMQENEVLQDNRR